jgi:hypothetical protein
MGAPLPGGVGTVGNDIDILRSKVEVRMAAADPATIQQCSQMCLEAVPVPDKASVSRENGRAMGVQGVHADVHMNMQWWRDPLSHQQHLRI